MSCTSCRAAVTEPTPNDKSIRAPHRRLSHRTRHLLIRQQTAVINGIRAHLAEFGIVAPLGRRGVEELLGIVADPKDKRLPEVARACLAGARCAQLRVLKTQILEFDRMINAWHRSSETSKRLDEIPGVLFPTTRSRHQQQQNGAVDHSPPAQIARPLAERSCDQQGRSAQPSRKGLSHRPSSRSQSALVPAMVGFG